MFFNTQDVVNKPEPENAEHIANATQRDSHGHLTSMAFSLLSVSD